MQQFQTPLRYPTQQSFPQYTFPNQNRFQTHKPTSFKFAKTPGQQLDRRQQRQQPMEVDPSTSRIRNRTTPFGPSAPQTKWTSEELQPFGPSAPQTKWTSEELHQQEQWEEENQEQYEYQPEWDDPTEPFGWEQEQQEQDFPTGAARMGRPNRTIWMGTRTTRTGFSNWSLSRRTTTSEQPELEHLEFNHQHAIRLPYIIIPEINAKLLIDTGASASSISTKIAESEFPEYILYSPFTVTTMHGTTQHNYILEIPSLATFNAYGQTHKFNIVDFSRKYDGILGLKLLEQMGAVIDFKQKVLRTKFTEIPLHLEDPTIHIGPRERKIVRLPVDRNLQEVLITHQEIAPGVEIPENITISEDYHVITEMINFNEYPIQVNMEKPISTILYHSTEEETKDQPYATEIKKIQKSNVIQKLRLEHLNTEEQAMIRNLCLEYKDLCHDEKIPLTFTSQIKHRIRLKDETPVYLKPYKKSPAQKEEVNKQVKKMLDQKIIQESSSPWSASVAIVPKKMDASVTTDASNVALGAVLSQGTVGQDKPIVWLHSLKEPNMKLQRWKIKLSEYDYEIIYKKGAINKNADALSRIEIHNQEEDSASTTPQISPEELDELIRNLTERPGDENNIAMTSRELDEILIRNLTERPGDENNIAMTSRELDEILDTLEDKAPNNWPLAKKNIKITEPPTHDEQLSDLSESLHSNANIEPDVTIPTTELAIDTQKSQIFIESHIFPTTKTHAIINGNSVHHVKLNKQNLSQELIDLIKEIMPQGKHFIYTTDEIYQKLCNVVRTLENTEEKLEIIIQYHEGQNIELENTEEKLKIIIHYLEYKSDHREINETCKQIKKAFYWPQMKTDVTNYIKNCEVCQNQ
ncbi:Integrase zinc binding domain [Popillia japonica]|uniref:RNA-directed DNA polymerase n=1 Tax=Popillia japonica TaxID=7064 RepID=A0AAW1KNA8_POPJA